MRSGITKCLFRQKSLQKLWYIWKFLYRIKISRFEKQLWNMFKISSDIKVFHVLPTCTRESKISISTYKIMYTSFSKVLMRSLSVYLPILGIAYPNNILFALGNDLVEILSLSVLKFSWKQIRPCHLCKLLEMVLI